MIKSLSIAAFLALAALVIAVISGWVMNIFALVNWTGEATAEFAIRVVGIFIPVIGALMGWM